VPPAPGHRVRRLAASARNWKLSFVTAIALLVGLPFVQRADAANDPLGDSWSPFCETSAAYGRICGTATRRGASDTWDARWSNGAVGVFTASNSGRSVTLRRGDPSGVSSGLRATYTGTLNDQCTNIAGTVTWAAGAGAATGSTGTWEATVLGAQCVLSGSASPSPSLSPSRTPTPTADQGAGVEEPPRVLSLDEQIQRCRLLAGATRDECLARTSVIWQDPAPCDDDGQDRCRQMAASTLMTQCQAIQDPAERVLCATGVAARWKDPGSCSIANDLGREECLLVVATETRNRQLLVDQVADDLLRDRLLSRYAVAARDPEAIPLIASDDAHDLAVLLTFTALAMDRDQLDTSHCARLRASDTTRIDAAGCRKLVAWAVQVAHQLAAAEAEGQGQAILIRLQAMLQSSGPELGEEILQTPDPGDVRAAPSN
jgi:hypothetical protein